MRELFNRFWLWFYGDGSAQDLMYELDGVTTPEHQIKRDIHPAGGSNEH